MATKPTHFIVNQSTGQKLRGTVAGIANYLGSTPFMVNLLTDKESNLNGWEIKSITPTTKTTKQ
jgi:hypothetical protein